MKTRNLLTLTLKQRTDGCLTKQNKMNKKKGREGNLHENSEVRQANGDLELNATNERVKRSDEKLRGNKKGSLS